MRDRDDDDLRFIRTEHDLKRKSRDRATPVLVVELCESPGIRGDRPNRNIHGDQKSSNGDCTPIGIPCR